jgi:ribosome-associated protein
MPDDSRIVIAAGVTIPVAELEFRASRSGGPGGQHVNTSSTRIELWWNAARSPSLTAGQRERVLSRLRSRLTEDGELRVVASDTRSQARNRALTIERFQALLAKALAVRKRRKPTRPPRAARERRLAEKRKQSERKRRRQTPGAED